MTLERATTPTTGDGRPASRTVREAAFDVLRARGLTTMFASPGSTEVPLLARLPRSSRSWPAASRAWPASPADAAAPERVLSGGSPIPTPSRRSSRRSPTPARPASSPGRVPTTRTPGPRSSRAERLGCPIWQESFGARAGFPQDHRLFAGHLRADRPRLRRTLARCDAVLAVGAPVFREYPYEPGPLVEPGTRVAVVTDDPEEAHRSPAEVAVVAPPAAVCAALAECLPARGADAEIPTRRVPPPLAAPVAGEALRAGHVLQAIADHLPADAALVEEAPSSRPELHARIPARAPLGFAMPAAVGLRMARRDRPVAAVVGDGASLYAIQSLWSAAHYGAGALFVVLANGRYAIMDRLAERAEGSSPSPGFEAVDVAAVASGLGCEARCVERHDDLVRILADVLPELAGRRDPLLVGVVVEPDPEFAP